ncbi:glycerophosphodiester phosphodiesterase family protein [Homoserinibacter sp. GY 40078]|uniref:glycerophosphodiester phosphodiesterase family protein n=1 Tax=Homoserinibacter sp. GY 40078 TaxID=2603275 RepID=UPI0011CB47AD|nr:glycerophosphodiester phosphodiesterase family protein [Homoserinibacter sp. GY 40078]TXK19228.1 glycerophosphodiester phosphodiesterase [Homoserinibacter sp. GY 40078]
MSEQRRPWVIGHRGASGYRPEHTRGAYELAFALGADAVEPDIVATRDGVLVVRHENEISGTTDVAAHPEFADRRATKRIDGQTLTGWFTEDFTWDELATLRARERLPEVRPASATFDGRFPILRLAELVRMVEEASVRHGRPIGLVAEIKHATHFESVGLPLDELAAPVLAGFGGPLVVESFEETVLGLLRQRGLDARYVYLLEAEGVAADLVARLGASAPDYDAQLTDDGLADLASRVDGISVDKRRLLRPDVRAGAVLVDRAHRAGLEVFTWTLRPENRFLTKPFRVGAGPREWGDWRGEFTEVLATGVDGVFADHPDLALAARDGD